MTALVQVGRQSADLAWRNLLHLRRSPGSLIAGLVEPVLFALLTGFVIGSNLGGAAYRQYLVAGLLAQTVTFSTSFTTVGLARDLHEGMTDRFRVLPIHRVAFLLGRTVSDLTACAVSVVATVACGLAMGWRPRSGALEVAGASLLILLAAHALSWVGVLIALVAPNVQVAASLGLVWLFPASFVSSGFVSTASLPGPLAVVAAWSPVSSLADALRVQLGNTELPPGFPAQHGWAAQHPAAYTVLWALGLIAVFVPLSTLRFRDRTRY